MSDKIAIYNEQATGDGGIARLISFLELTSEQTNLGTGPSLADVITVGATGNGTDLESMGSIDLNAGKVYRIDGQQVVGFTVTADFTGTDSQKITAIIAALIAHGLIAQS